MVSPPSRRYASSPAAGWCDRSWGCRGPALRPCWLPRASRFWTTRAISTLLDGARLRLAQCGRGAIDGALTQRQGYAERRIAREARARCIARLRRGVAPGWISRRLMPKCWPPQTMTSPNGCWREPRLASAGAAIRRGAIGSTRLRDGLTAVPERARTLGGCRFVPWRGQILVIRELAAATAPYRLEPGETVLWDRRFAATLPADAPGGLTLGYLAREEKASRSVIPAVCRVWSSRPAGVLGSGGSGCGTGSRLSPIRG